MARSPSGFQLSPGTRRTRLLRELLIAELSEQRFRGWRRGAALLFAAASVLVFSVARWPERLGSPARDAILGWWLLSAVALASLTVLTWQAERRRERILRQMEPRR